MAAAFVFLEAQHRDPGLPGVLREALKIEALLTAAGIDYFIETDSYVGGLLFRRELTGAFFYVLPVDRERTQGLLTSENYKPYKTG